jgi:hypothetical protein
MSGKHGEAELEIENGDLDLKIAHHDCTFRELRNFSNTTLLKETWTQKEQAYRCWSSVERKPSNEQEAPECPEQ